MKYFGVVTISGGVGEVFHEEGCDVFVLDFDEAKEDPEYIREWIERLEELPPFKGRRALIADLRDLEGDRS